MPDLLERLTAALSDRYAIEREVGRGGMAVVFEAEDLRHHRQVAIKVLHPELTATLGSERFLNEIEIVAGLQHPHILPLYESGEADGLLYYVMPYAKGESLRKRLDREKQLAVDESVRIAAEVADGLDYAHRQGVVHRDIKPGNILLSEGHAVIADFGIARAVEAAQRERITSTGLGVGTPLYASPEQATAQETLDGRTDVYSLGCVLYEMLAGAPPLTGATPQIIQARRVSETPSPLHNLRDTVPPALDHVIARALARIPADRFATAAQFGQALQAVLFAATPAALTDLTATPGVLSTTPTDVAPAPRRRGLVWLVAAVTVIGVAAVAWFAVQRLVVSGTGSEPEASPISAFRETRLTHSGDVYLPSISPDGRYLAFAVPEATGAARRVVVRDREDIEPDRAVAVVDEMDRLYWLPDGSGVVLDGTYQGTEGYYSVPRTGGVLQRVPGRGVFSPDGTEVLDWDWERNLVFVLAADRSDAGGQPERLDSIPIADDRVGIRDVAYSPGGDYLAVATRSEGTGALWIVGRDSGRQIKLVDAYAMPGSLYWREDERVLYYIERLARGWHAVKRVSITRSGEAASDPQQLLQVSTVTYQGRYVTADGRLLVVPRSNVDLRIVTLRRSGADSLLVEPIRGTNHVTDATDMYFTPSPDSRMVAFWKKGVLGVNLFVVPMEGGEPRQLTTSGTVWFFGWSPDSRVLAFATTTGDTPAVWFVPVEGGEPAPLVGSVTNGQLWWGSGPLINRLPGGSLWVADSLWVRSGAERLAFTAENIQRPNAVVEGISRPLVTNDSLGLIGNPVTASPDGRWVAANWGRSDAPGLWRISLTDSTQTLVAPDTRSTSYIPLGWTRDGSGVFVTPSVGVLDRNEYPVFLLPGGGGEAELLFTRRPAGGYGCETLYDGEQLSFVCFESLSSSSDAWLIENFDPQAD